MRFAIGLLVATVAVATAKPVQVEYDAFIQKASAIDDPADQDEEGIPEGDSSTDIQDEINITPSVRLTKEMLWEASVPDYADVKNGAKVKTFKKEADARAWVYKHSGAHWSINYPMPEGINPAAGFGADASFLQMGSGEGSGSGAEEDDAAAVAGGAGTADADGSGDADADAKAFCADCVKKLTDVNNRIDDVESKLKAHQDAITGITATKGEIVDVSVRRAGDNDEAAADAANAEAGSGDDATAEAGSGDAATAEADADADAEAGSAAGSADAAAAPAAASFIEKIRRLRRKLF